jgi:hypothetical protein
MIHIPQLIEPAMSGQGQTIRIGFAAGDFAFILPDAIQHLGLAN